MKVGFTGGVVFASPVIIFELCSFVAPGLYRDEKHWFISIVFSSPPFPLRRPFCLFHGFSIRF
ncbi:MAG: twin-arginine translocase subunit TatC [Deltaproteobacteria bacterium]|nr:twin-arginine translocase subunit TatC [Deltaproteobacteria bacterium]